MTPAPVVEQHGRIAIVRDDLVPGGTKARYLGRLFDLHDVVAYASPAYGGAQLALAYCAAAKGKQAVIFTAKRKQPHARTLEARAAGARVFLVPNGYLSHVQAKARLFATEQGAHYLEFGGESQETLAAIAHVAAEVWRAHGPFDEVWSAAGSGVLTRGLQFGMPGAPRFFAVQVGRDLKPENAGRAEVIASPLSFEQEERSRPPFPSCPNYDAKAWKLCEARAKGRALFWNVLGPSPTGAARRA